jgi:hypothetical protein
MKLLRELVKEKGVVASGRPPIISMTNPPDRFLQARESINQRPFCLRKSSNPFISDLFNVSENE